jgi:hypothetical protein
MSPEMEFVLDYWPIVVMVPLLLLLIALLATVTHFMDKRDESRR